MKQERELEALKKKHEKAVGIIERFMMDQDFGVKMNVEFYREIKQFLDGK